jgi:hypothetical protein
MKRSDVGPEVTTLKGKLKSLGYVLTNSNEFDYVTDATVRHFQEKNGLTKDGIVGPRTEAQLASTKPLEQQTNVIQWVANTPYLSQRDNENVPGGTCNVTSLAMILSFWGIKAKDDPSDAAIEQLEDELFLRLEQTDAQEYFKKNFPSLVKQGFNARNVHGMLIWLAKQYGFVDKYSEGTSWKDMADFGRSFGPMIISGAFTGSGHIVCLTGMTISGDMIVHDPYGDWNTKYKSREGAFRIYNREDMEQILAGTSKSLKRTHRIARN